MRLKEGREVCITEGGANSVMKDCNIVRLEGKVDIGSVQALAETLGTEYFCYCVQKEQPDSCLSQQVKKAETAFKLERIQR